MPRKIKTFKEACKALNLDPTLPEFPEFSEKERKAMQAHYQLVIIAKALNGNWVPDWSNWNEKKHFPWFAFQDGCFVLYGVLFNYTTLFLGSRLCFRSPELAKYAGKQFLDLYKDYLL